jgi:uncharacterized protein (UPF0335 family)
VSEIGHNSITFAADQLRTIIERIERLNEERDTIGEDIRDVFAEAKANGFDTKVIRKIDAVERQEQETVMELYLVALGMLPDRGIKNEATSGDKN